MFKPMRKPAAFALAVMVACHAGCQTTSRHQTTGSQVLAGLQVDSIDHSYSDVSHPAIGYSVSEFQSMAVASHPTLVQASAQICHETANWTQVGLYPNPSIEVESASNNAPLDMAHTFISQPLVTGGKLTLNRAVASHSVANAQWNAEAESVRLKNEVAIRVVRVQQAERELEIARAMLDTATQMHHLSKQLFEREEVAESDVVQSKLHFEESRMRLNSAEAKRARTRALLASICGIADGQEWSVSGRLDDEISEILEDESTELRVRANPQFQAARSSVAQARAQVLREDKQAIPNLKLTTGLGRLYGESPGYMMYTVNIGMNVPVWNKNSGNRAAAVGSLIAKESDAERIRLAYLAMAKKSREHYERLLVQVDIYRNEILPGAEETLRMALSLYQEGEIDMLRVLEARQALQECHLENAEAIADLRVLAIELNGFFLTYERDANAPDLRAGGSVVSRESAW